jgi:hypothetical protein
MCVNSHHTITTHKLRNHVIANTTSNLPNAASQPFRVGSDAETTYFRKPNTENKHHILLIGKIWVWRMREKLLMGVRQRHRLLAREFSTIIIPHDALSSLPINFHMEGGARQWDKQRSITLSSTQALTHRTHTHTQILTQRKLWPISQFLNPLKSGFKFGQHLTREATGSLPLLNAPSTWPNCFGPLAPTECLWAGTTPLDWLGFNTTVVAHSGLTLLTEPIWSLRIDPTSSRPESTSHNKSVHIPSQSIQLAS